MNEIARVQAAEKNHGLTYPRHVLYAGESARRIAFITQAFPHSVVTNFAIGAEPELGVTGVMRHKLDAGLRSVKNEFVGAIVAADTQTNVPTVIGSDVEMVGKCKPKNQRELHGSLVDMYTASEFTGEDPFYQVESASGLLHLNGKRVQMEDIHGCLVVLGKKDLKKLLSEEGFAAYLSEFAAFYSQPPYTTHNMKPITPADLSGGLSLPVLTRMGIVSSVEGVDRRDDAFRIALKENIHVVAVGISPHILTSVQVDPQVAIHGWSWLDEVTDHALSPSP